MVLEVEKNGKIAHLKLDLDELSEVALALSERCRSCAFIAGFVPAMADRLGKAVAHMLYTPPPAQDRPRPGSKAS